MTEQETEQERKTREYWSRAYDAIIDNKDKLPYEPTAVLTPAKERKITYRDLLDLDFTR